MKSFAIAALAAVASADRTDFPSFDALHAHCEITMKSDNDCMAVYATIADVINNDRDTASPPGHYKTKEFQRNIWLWSTRLTANGKYTDD